MPAPLRGLKNIRTLAGRVDAAALPYRGFMQITCLEMEKARRGAERNSAAQRMRDIDARLEDIEKEKRALLAAVNPRARPRGAPKSSGSIRAPGQPEKPAAPLPGRGFRIRYGGRP
jgi:hypothetical protein